MKELKKFTDEEVQTFIQKSITALQHAFDGCKEHGCDFEVDIGTLIDVNTSIVATFVYDFLNSIEVIYTPLLGKQASKQSILKYMVRSLNKAIESEKKRIITLN